ncbi:hypothetical protein ZWY2020_027977 [Hordeum vulgare]|nr:hypothetical protein ZWY2020_027977 [Hordeum vulgare]
MHLHLVQWLDSSFIDTIKVWQQEWLYITESHDAEWETPPRFRYEPPTRLVSWTEKGLDWGEAAEVEALQRCVSILVKKKKIELTNVVQVMLCRCLLPYQHRAFPMWSYILDGSVTVQHFYRTNPRQSVEGAVQAA